MICIVGQREQRSPFVRRSAKGARGAAAPAPVPGVRRAGRRRRAARRAAAAPAGGRARRLRRPQWR